MTPCACHCAACRAAGHGNKCVVLRIGLLRLFHGEADPVDLVLQHYYHWASGWDTARFDAAILSVQYGPAGDVIAAGGKDGLHLICAQTGVNLLCLKGHSAQINGVGFSLDGTMLASCSGEYVKNQYGEHGDNSVRLWDVGTGKELKKLEGHSDTVWECKFAPKGDIIVSGSSDKTLKIWDVESGTCQATLEGHSGGVSCVSFSPADPGQLVTGSHDKTVKLWSVADGQCLQTLKGHSDYVRTLSWTCDGNLLASGGDDERIILWDAKKGERLMELKGHSGQVWCLEWAPDGSQLVSGQFGKIKFWSPTGECLNTLKGHSNYVRTVSWRFDGKVLASGGDDSRIILLDPKRDERLPELKGGDRPPMDRGSDRWGVGGDSGDRPIEAHGGTWRPRHMGRSRPLCRFYSTPNGCMRGEMCTFAHVDSSSLL